MQVMFGAALARKGGDLAAIANLKIEANRTTPSGVPRKASLATIALSKIVADHIHIQPDALAASLPQAADGAAERKNFMHKKIFGMEEKERQLGMAAWAVEKSAEKRRKLRMQRRMSEMGEPLASSGVPTTVAGTAPSPPPTTTTTATDTSTATTTTTPKGSSLASRVSSAASETMSTSSILRPNERSTLIANRLKEQGQDFSNLTRTQQSYIRIPNVSSIPTQLGKEQLMTGLYVRERSEWRQASEQQPDASREFPREPRIYSHEPLIYSHEPLIYSRSRSPFLSSPSLKSTHAHSCFARRYHHILSLWKERPPGLLLSIAGSVTEKMLLIPQFRDGFEADMHALITATEAWVTDDGTTNGISGCMGRVKKNCDNRYERRTNARPSGSIIDSNAH